MKDLLGSEWLVREAFFILTELAETSVHHVLKDTDELLRHSYEIGLEVKLLGAVDDLRYFLANDPKLLLKNCWAFKLKLDVLEKKLPELEAELPISKEFYKEMRLIFEELEEYETK